MQPHLHPGPEKIEYITVVAGELTVIFFDPSGTVTDKKTIKSDSKDFKCRVPAYTWHTYVVRSPFAITYETMDGIYNPVNWKNFASWAPGESTIQAGEYLEKLREAST